MSSHFPIFPEQTQAFGPFQNPKDPYCLVLQPRMGNGRRLSLCLRQDVGNPRPGDREAGSFVPRQGRSALTSEIAVLKCGEVYAETQMDRNAKCAVRVRMYLAGHAFNCGFFRPSESRIGFPACGNLSPPQKYRVRSSF